MPKLLSQRLLVGSLALAACGGSRDSTAAVLGDASHAGPFDGGALSQPGDAEGSSDAASGEEIGVPDAAESVADAGLPAVRYIGRVDRTDAAGPRFAWSGSTLVARFSGPSIGVRLADSGNYFAVFLDGAQQAQPLVPTSGQREYPLAANLSPGAHELRLYRLTEANQGDTQFLGLLLDPAGALLPPGPAASRRIELVGDSISCGYGDTGMGPNCSFSTKTEDHYLTYGAIAARNLNAELVTIAWSGKGMYRNYSGDMTETMPVLYLRALPDQAASTWDFAKYTPDAVVINLGTNDFATGDPGQAYVNAYLSFVHVVRTKYPNAYIACTIGPMLGDPNLSTARGYINSVVTSMKSQGDARIGYLEFPTQNPANGLGCDYHPSVTTHQVMGAQLTAALKTALGW